MYLIFVVFVVGTLMGFWLNHIIYNSANKLSPVIKILNRRFFYWVKVIERNDVFALYEGIDVCKKLHQDSVGEFLNSPTQENRLNATGYIFILFVIMYSFYSKYNGEDLRKLHSDNIDENIKKP